VYAPRPLRPMHRFLPASAPRGDRLANQACFLWHLAHEGGNLPKLFSKQMFTSARAFASTVLSPSVQCDLLDSDILWDVVWRLLFSPTLSAADINIAREGKFLLSNLSNGMIQARVLLKRRPLKLDTRDYDFLIVQDPRPFRVSPNTRLIVRYHDLIPLIRPDTMRNTWYINWHHRAIRRQTDRTLFVCNSEPTREDLTTVYPELHATSTTIPNMLSDTYYRDECVEMVSRIIERRRSRLTGLPMNADRTNGPPKFVLCVSTLEPRKNFLGLIEAFNTLRGRAAKGSTVDDLKLVIVGSPGWKFEPILAAMRDLTARGELVHLESVPAEEMRVLYSHAEAFVFPSNYEGFGFPPLEAMQCGTPVIASDISTHRWVLGDAALYCNPYDATSIAAAIERLVASDESAGLRETLVERGAQRVKRYQSDRCVREWVDLFDRLKSGRGLAERRKSFVSSEPAWLAKVA
jgi:glycosyltransferase involved in cell wall biosynthesis